MDDRNVLPHVRSFFLVRTSSPTCTVHPFISEWSVPIFPHVQSISICSTLFMKKMRTTTQLVLANTVPMCLTGGAGTKPLLGSANTVQRQVRVRLGQVRLGLVRLGWVRLATTGF